MLIFLILPRISGSSVGVLDGPHIDWSGRPGSLLLIGVFLEHRSCFALEFGGSLPYDFALKHVKRGCCSPVVVATSS